MTKCDKIGHNFRDIKSSLLVLPPDTKRERCQDCGHEETFIVKTATHDQAYATAHKRDFIQPWQKEEWNLAYPDRKIIVDPAKKKEIAQFLQEKYLKQRKSTIAIQYYASFGATKEFAPVLKWHMGQE